MRTLLLLLFSTFLGTCVRAQTTDFQQGVDYRIEVALNDQSHELLGQLELRYTNNAPTALNELFFHCWPRAYRNTETAFAKQMLRHGSTRFQFAKAEDRGDMSGLNFTVDGDTIDWAFTEEHTDIARLELSEPLTPGQTVVVRTPFRVKIPKSFSRLGHVGESYQITQWYPKPAVYDKDGWHAMPYLNLGEYFADFGTFDVRITLPDNYVVGATGTLETADELGKLRQKAEKDRQELERRAAADDLENGFVLEPFPESSATTKTLHYTADRVHDFAWFADKRFKVLHETLELAGEEPKDIWAMFNETEAGLWVKATDYLKRSVRFYSDKIGTYPHPQMTGVMSALSVGGGMEYPMITVIGRSASAESLDEVLAHEVGHNWFQGILGTNERDHPWLDEGLNSYYEQRYMQEFYPDQKPGIDLGIAHLDVDRLGYHYTARQGKDQAPDTHSDSLSMMNYWIAAYSKPALALHELAQLTSTAAVDSAMQAFYAEWKFRHPGPEDFFAAIEENTSLTTRPWFPQAFMTTYTSDRRTGLAPGFAPYNSGQRATPAPPPGEHNPLDIYPGNDAGLLGQRKFAFRPLIGQEDVDLKQIFYTPVAAFNDHDGPQLGLALHNRTLEPRKFEWLLAPLYGFDSGEVTGLVGARYRLPFATGKYRQLMGSAGVQRFSDFTLGRTDVAYPYLRLATKLQLELRHPEVSEVTSHFYLQQVLLDRSRPVFGSEGDVTGDRSESDLFLRFGYQRNRNRELTPLGYRIQLEQRLANETTPFRDNHLRLDAEIKGGLQYERNHFLRYRGYGGVFLINELRESSAHIPTGFSLVDNAFADYAYDDLFIGRGLGGFAAQQFGNGQGGFRAPIDRAFGFGSSNSYMVAVNVDADVPALPAYLPIGFFLDAGYYGDKSFGNDPLTGKFSWVGGVSLTALQGRVGLYLPLISDPDTKLLLEQRGGPVDRISVRLNLAGWMPWRWVDDVF